MKRYVSLLALLSVAASVAQAQTKAPCQVKGTIKGLGNQPIVVFYDWQSQQRRDTVQVRNDQFIYAARPSDDGRFNLKIVPGRYTPIWYEPGVITVTGTLSDIKKLRVGGTLENALTTQYNEQVGWKLGQEQ